MPQNRIYTPENNHKNLFEHLEKEQSITVFVKARQVELKGKVSHFPRNSRFDEDLRVAIEAVDNSFYGQLVIAAVTNDYGQHHISEIEFR